MQKYPSNRRSLILFVLLSRADIRFYYFCWLLFIFVETYRTESNARMFRHSFEPVLPLKISDVRNTKHKLDTVVALNRVYLALFELRYVLFTLIERRSRHTDPSDPCLCKYDYRTFSMSAFDIWLCYHVTRVVWCSLVRTRPQNNTRCNELRWCSAPRKYIYQTLKRRSLKRLWILINKRLAFGSFMLNLCISVNT